MTRSMVWTTKEGRKMPIRKLEDQHLLNILAYLQRRAPLLKDRESLKLLSLPEPNGDMAQLAFSQDIAYLAEQQSDDWLEEQPLYQELEKEATHPSPSHPRLFPEGGRMKMPSTRKFQPETPGGLQAMIDAIRRLLRDAADDTPTAAGLQLYSVVMVTSGVMKKELSRCCRKQQWIADAPVLLVFCADISRFEKWLISNGERPHYRSETWLEVSKADTYIFAEAVSELLRAHGYGTCFSGFILNSAFTVGKILMMPGGVFPLILMAPGSQMIQCPQSKAVWGAPASFTASSIGTRASTSSTSKNNTANRVWSSEAAFPLFAQKFYPKDMVEEGDAELEKAPKDG